MSSWFKSSFSDNGPQCVEVRFDQDTVLIRDSKYQGNPAVQPIITITRSSWRAFLDTVAGREAETWRGLPTITSDAEDNTILQALDGTTLTYTAGEWHAFKAGIGIGEFA